MASFADYMNGYGESDYEKKKKKKEEEERRKKLISPADEIAPVKTFTPTKTSEKSSYFDDGYDFGDISKTILGVAKAAGKSIVSPVVNSIKEDKAAEEKKQATFDETMRKKYSAMSLEDIEKEYSRIEKEEKEHKEKNGGKVFNYLAKVGTSLDNSMSGQPMEATRTHSQLMEATRTQSQANIDKIDDLKREKEILNIYRKKKATEEYLGGLDEKQLKMLDNIAEAKDLENAAPFSILAPQGGMDATTYSKITEVERTAGKESREKLYNQLKKKNPKKSDEEINELIDNMVELRRSQVNAQEREKEQAELQQAATEHPVASFLLSRGVNLLSGGGLVEPYMQRGNEYGLDTNAPGFAFANASADIDQQIQLDHDWKIGEVDAFDLFYEVGTGMVDNVGRLALAGGNPTASGAIMFSQVATQGIIEGKEKGYSDSKALTMGLLQGTFEAISEKMGLDYVLGSGGGALKKLAKSFVAEGTEEITSSWLNRIADQIANGNHSELSKQYKAYKNEGLTDAQALTKVVLNTLGEDTKSFVVAGLSGFGVGGVAAVSSAVSNAQQKKANQLTEDKLSDKAKTVFDKVVEDRIAEATEENGGNTISKREEKKIRQAVLDEIQKGYMNIDNVESILGGEDFEAYKTAKDLTDENIASGKEVIENLKKAKDTLQEEYDNLYKMKNGEKSDEQKDRQSELKEKIADIDARIEKTQGIIESLGNDTRLKDLKTKLGQNVFELVKDTELAESYRGVGEKFQPDFEKFKGAKYEDAARKTLENGVKAGASNSNIMRAFLETNAKYSADTGVVIEYKTEKEIVQDFVDRATSEIEELEKIPEAKRTAEESELLKDVKSALADVKSGKRKVHGKVSNTITVNLDSERALDVTIGHEVGHLLEKTKVHKSGKLQKAVFAYAKTKGVNIAEEVRIREVDYVGIKNANAKNELVCDLLGEYIGTDYDFIKSLSVENKSVFHELWESIKYLCRIATAGSKEARQLERVKRNFEKAYKEVAKSGAKAEGVKHSLSDIKDLSARGLFYEISKPSIDIATIERAQNVTEGDKKRLTVAKEQYVTYGEHLLNNYTNYSTKELNQLAVALKLKDTWSDEAYTAGQFVKKLESKVEEYKNDIRNSVLGESTDKTDEQIIEEQADEEVDLAERIRRVNAELGATMTSLNNTIPYISGVSKLWKQLENREITQEQYDEVLRKNARYRELDDKANALRGEFDNLVKELETVKGKEWKELRYETLYPSKVKYSLSSEQEAYFKDSKVRDENGNLKVMYHGTSKGNFTVFDTYGSKYGLFGQGSYFTDNKSVAESYTNKGKGEDKQVYETYLNITNPIDMDAQADVDAWAKALPDADFSNCTTNEDCYRAMEDYFEDEGYYKYEASEIAMDVIQSMGYDGITHIGGGRRTGTSDTSHQVYIAFEPEQIKNIDNIAPTKDADIRYSLSEDSEGNKLTAKQSEYFAGTKAVDRNGNLLKVYHTTKNDFTVFDKAKKGEATEDANTYLGFFFTDDEEYMQNFPEFENGKTESYYLDMKNPIDMTNISREAFMDVVEVMGGDVGDASILFDEELEAAHNRAKVRGDNNVSLQLGRLLDELTGEFYYNDFIRELQPHYDELMSKGYDGVINYMDELLGVKEYIVLDSNQAKLTSNLNPTADADVRYSVTTEKTPQAKSRKTMKPTNSNLQKDMWSVRDIRNKTMLENNYTQADVDQMNEFMDNLATFMEKAGVTYKFIGLEDVNNAKVKVVYDTDGTPKRITMSAMVKNGEYPVNFDFTTICKKRQSMSMVIEELARRKNGDGERALDEIDLDAKALWTINEELRKAGLETACLGCFVESKRYNIQNFANKATKMWNSIVDEIRQEQGKTEPVGSFNFAEGIDLEKVNYSKVDKIFRAYRDVKGRTSPEKRMRALIKNGGEMYQKYLQPSDLMTPEGIEGLKSLSTNKNDFYGIIKGVYGQAAPKEVMSFSPYNSEIALLPDKKGKKMKMAEYIAKIGGVRMQSFSDFIVSNVYDYMQMVADLAAKRLPAHAYTKEIAFAKIFGKTGIKINMSVMFDIDPSLSSDYAGLQFIPDANGTEEYEGVKGRFEYLVADQKRSDKVLAETGERPYVQSIGFDEAVKLQNTEGYSRNIGIIGVGYSDNHIKKMLRDNNIRYVIPYHSSSLPSEIKAVTNISKATDYTEYQNTKTARGDALVGLGGFDIYKDVAKTNNPKQTAKNYLDYCESKNYTPVFPQFAKEENYYKLLFDFDPYDTITGEYSPQTEVKNIYEGYNTEEGLTSTKEIERLIEEEMKIQNDANRQRNAKISDVVDSVLEQLGIENDKVGFSISSEGAKPSKNGRIYGKDFIFRENTADDIAPVGVAKNTTTTEKVAPTVAQESVAPTPTSVAEPLEETPIRTTKQKLSAKLQQSHAELEKNIQLREKSNAYYDEKIAKAQAEYDAKKNKDTKAANNLLRSIERYKRLKGSAEADYKKRISDIESRITKLDDQLLSNHDKADRLERYKKRADARLEADKKLLKEEFEQRKAELQEEIADKNTFVRNKALALYNELNGLRKGVRASEDLAFFLDEGFNWSELKSTLLKVSRWSDVVLNPESEIESIVRESIGRDYEDKASHGMDDLDAEYDKQVKQLEEEAQKKLDEFKVANQRMTKQQEYTSQMEELVGDTSTWKDKKLGISYEVNTLRRNLRDIVRDSNGNKDIAKADAIYDELQGKYNHNEAELNRESNRIKQQFAEMKITKAEDTYIQMLGEFRHNPETTLTEEVVKEYYEKHKKYIDEAKVDKAIEESRKLYDDLLVRVNQVLSEQGMKEIPYRQGYFPHFTEDKQGILGRIFNWKTQNNEIPTDIAGITETFEPNRSWQSFNKQRKTDETDYSFTKGLDSYVQGSLDWIYHIEDIQKRRALENHIRYTHSEDGVKAKVDAILDSEVYDADQMQEQIDLVYREARNPLNNFIQDFHTATNTLAGKKSTFDRDLEQRTNRKVYSVMTNLSNRVSGNMVAGSVSSALTNFIPITQSWVEVSPVTSLRAMGETITSTIRDDGTIDKSDFLTNRLNKSENLYKTNWDKVGKGVSFLMEAIDNFTSQTVWRSKYIQNMSKGMSESEAIKNADQFAANVMADRSRGNQPTLFDSKSPVAKIFTAFQLEVNNQYGYFFKDAPQDIANKSKARLVAGYTTAFFGAYAYNALYSSLTGRDAAFDPIGIIEDLMRDLGFGGDDDDEEEEIAPVDVVMNLTNNILEEVPFIGGLLGGGRIPISSAMPYGGIMEAWEGTLQDFSEGNYKTLTKEWLNPVYYLALPMGGGQIRKTNQGVAMFSDDHPVAGSYTDSGNLRFPVEDTPWNRIQAGVFGQYANKNARTYFDEGYAPLKENQIKEYAEADMPIADYWKYREGLKDLSKQDEKASYINGLDISKKQKDVLKSYLYDEEGYKEENPEKYAFLEREGIGYLGYKELDEDTQSAWSWAFKHQDEYEYYKENGVLPGDYSTYYIPMLDFKDEDDQAYQWSFDNPEKATVGKVFGDGVKEYRQYAKDLDEIKADKDSNGKTISGSAKEKKKAYIWSLPIDYGQKIILYRSLYDSKDDKAAYNQDIFDYLIGRDDISYEDKLTICEELGFTVNRETGYISW